MSPVIFSLKKKETFKIKYFTHYLAEFSLPFNLNNTMILASPVLPFVNLLSLGYGMLSPLFFSLFKLKYFLRPPSL